MLNQFITELEKRTKIESLLSKFNKLFYWSLDSPHFSDEAFSELLNVIELGGRSSLNVAIQAGVRWANSVQRMSLRKAIFSRGFITPACLWAYRSLRGSHEPCLRSFEATEMSFMQILLLRHIDPSNSVPFLIETFQNRSDTPEELKELSRLCLITILNNGIAPDLLKALRTRYPRIDVLHNLRTAIPGRGTAARRAPTCGSDDFHQVVRSVLEVKELSSFTRVLYLTWLFYVPLSDTDYSQLWLTQADRNYFRMLGGSGIIDRSSGGYILTSDLSKRGMAKRFLYETYPLAKESIQKSKTAKIKEERERRVKTTELDRQGLEMSPDGIICIDQPKSLYYMNPAAEKTLQTENWLRMTLFGSISFEDAVRKYSKEKVIANIRKSGFDKGVSAQIFGDRISLESRGKHFDVELGPQVILIRNTTDQNLINKEIGKLYRHELSAAIDVIGIGIDSAKRLALEGSINESVKILDQTENKRLELFHMLEERIDFIRLHSDSFQVRPLCVNLNLLVDKCVSNYVEAATSKGVSIQSNHLEEHGIFVSGEERFLKRAVDNLIRNAVKFCDHGGKVEIRLEISTKDAICTVEDDGPGIPPAHLGKIFQLGFTTGGSGRGLYLARKIAKAHGGRLEVRSSVGNGACFTLTLPRMLEN
jgi:signal transduction histidine kinase